MANAMLDARQEDGGYRRVELITGERRRRRWTAEEKARIVAESFEEGANISEVARRNGVARGLVTPLLDLSNINHGLLLPILLHCVDDHGRPMLGPPREGRETEEFLRNAHTDIPMVVQAMRRYWMPTRY